MCDLNRHWKLSKTKKFNFCIDKSHLFKVSVNTGLPNGAVVSVTRSIYNYCFHESFHKVLVTIDGNSTLCLQYHFDREERSIVAKEPHGNAKKEIAFIRSKSSLLEKVKNSGKLPKTIVWHVLQESGGLEGVQGKNSLVRNR